MRMGNSAHRQPPRRVRGYVEWLEPCEHLRQRLFAAAGAARLPEARAGRREVDQPLLPRLTIRSGGQLGGTAWEPVSDQVAYDAFRTQERYHCGSGESSGSRTLPHDPVGV